MGYATRKVKVRRHNNAMRLLAATALAGVRYDAWPAPIAPNAVEAIDTRGSRIMPYERTLVATVYATAEYLGIE